MLAACAVRTFNNRSDIVRSLTLTMTVNAKATIDRPILTIIKGVWKRLKLPKEIPLCLVTENEQHVGVTNIQLLS